MAQYEDVNNLLLKLSYLGTTKAELTGAALIGKHPVHEGSWLNRKYIPITLVELKKIEDATKKTIPASYAQFLIEYSNGLNVLTNTLCLFGYRYNYIRDMDHIWQPYSIIEVNKYKYERPLNAEKDMFFIGGYVWDGSLIYMTPDQRVHFCRRHDSQSLISWDSLHSMLISEIERLYTLFDSTGLQIDPSKPTTPVE